MSLDPRTRHVIEDRAEYDKDWRLVARTGGQYDVKATTQTDHPCYCQKCGATCSCPTKEGPRRDDA